MELAERPKAILLLEDGTLYEGLAGGKIGTAVGEICFNTGMTGYQEIFTDPSYFGQILVANPARGTGTERVGPQPIAHRRLPRSSRASPEFGVSPGLRTLTVTEEFRAEDGLLRGPPGRGPRSEKRQTTPWSSIESAILRKPAMLAPST